ncbi:hypothetical protein CDD80_7177 [Ophiocordyceps camponoti-rufipedis]|uniref:Uncharacterized protein n=1 Tax=Ophiocordyceps camponoti-rufipedis TaxID=2004952 RepID=A0A2C5ZEC3_9HYPO|nr:hypothetical protein CDD80_7177 [Ophiocordyceps camponoti-rufipedis]
MLPDPTASDTMPPAIERLALHLPWRPLWSQGATTSRPVDACLQDHTYALRRGPIAAAFREVHASMNGTDYRPRVELVMRSYFCGPTANQTCASQVEQIMNRAESRVGHVGQQGLQPSQGTDLLFAALVESDLLPAPEMMDHDGGSSGEGTESRVEPPLPEEEPETQVEPPLPQEQPESRPEPPLPQQQPESQIEPPLPQQQPQIPPAGSHPLGHQGAGQADEFMRDLPDVLQPSENVCHAATNVNSSCEDRSPRESVARVVVEAEMASNDGRELSTDWASLLQIQRDPWVEIALLALMGNMANGNDKSLPKRGEPSYSPAVVKAKFCKRFSDWTEETCHAAVKKSPKAPAVTTSPTIPAATTSPTAPAAMPKCPVGEVKVRFKISDGWLSGTVNTVRFAINGNTEAVYQVPISLPGREYEQILTKEQLERRGLKSIASFYSIQISNVAGVGLFSVDLDYAAIHVKCADSGVEWKAVKTLYGSVGTGSIWSPEIAAGDWEVHK